MKTIALVLSLVALGSCVDYCSISQKHIACKNDGQIAAACRGTSKMITLTDDLKGLLVDQHNIKRNEIALGRIPNYQAALRMPTIEWDDELATLAELNVKTCKFAHDANRNTQRFEHSGQNLAYWSGYPAITPKDSILRAIEGWFDEYKNADQSVIDSYKSTSKPSGHFTVMVADRNIRLGCGVLETVEGKMTTYKLACNYATTNMMEWPIYTKGISASGCTTGKNPKYPGLCSTKEQVDANKFY